MSNQANPAEEFLLLLNRFLAVSHACDKPSAITAASHQLTTFMRQPIGFEALLWTLQMQPLERNSLILATSLLKDKLKFDFETLDKSQLGNYYQQLSKVSEMIQCHNHAAFGNLSLALAYLFLHLLAHEQQSLFSMLSAWQEPLPHHYNYYFKVLESVAAEVDNPRLVITEESRFNAKRNALAQQSSVLQTMSQRGQAAWDMPGVNRQCLLESFACWVELFPGKDVLDQLPSHFLMLRMAEGLGREGDGDSACECLRVIVTQLTNPSESQHLFDFLSELIVRVLALADRCLAEQDTSQAEQYLAVVLQFSRRSAPLLLAGEPAVLQFLGRLVDLTSDTRLNNFDNFCSYWEEQLETAFINRSTTLHSLLPALHDALIHHIKYSQSHLKQLNSRPESRVSADSRYGSDTDRFRSEAAPIFSLISKLMGSGEYLSMVTAKLRAAAALGLGSDVLVVLQALLHSLVGNLGGLNQQNQQAILLVNSFQEVGAVSVALRRSFLRVFRSLIELPNQPPAFLQKLFYLASTCFNQPLLAEAASRTFSRGCQTHAQTLSSMTNQFISVLQAYPEQQQLARGVIYLVCSSPQLGSNSLLQVLHILYGAATAEGSTKQRRKECLNALISAFRAMKDQPHLQILKQYLKEFTRQIWNWLKVGLCEPQSLKDDEDPDVERLVKFVKHIMRAIGMQFGEFVCDLLENLMLAFEKYPVCSYLYVVEVAVTVLAGAEWEQYLMSIFQRCCAITYQHLGSLERLERYTYLLDDFIGMSKRLFVFNARVIFTSGQLPALVDLCASAFTEVPAPKVVKAAAAFFQALCLPYWRPEFVASYNSRKDADPCLPHPNDSHFYIQLRPLLIAQMPQVLTRMLQHLSTVPVETTREILLDALYAEIKAFPEENTQIWATSLGKLDSDILLGGEKERFMELLICSGSAQFGPAEEATKQLKRMLMLINRRMINSAKRSKLHIP